MSYVWLSNEKIQALLEKDIKGTPGMEHYLEKWGDYAMKRSGLEVGEEEFHVEHAKFETEYFAKLRPQIRMITEKLCCEFKRTMMCVEYIF